MSGLPSNLAPVGGVLCFLKSLTSALLGIPYVGALSCQIRLPGDVGRLSGDTLRDHIVAEMKIVNFLYLLYLFLRCPSKHSL